MDTTMICLAARKEGVDVYNTPTPESLKIIQQLQEDFKQHYQDHKTKRDKYCNKDTYKLTHEPM